MIDENWDRDYLKMWLGKYLLESPYSFTSRFGSGELRYTKIIVNGIEFRTSLQGGDVVVCFCSVYRNSTSGGIWPFCSPDNRQFNVPYDLVKSHMIEYTREKKLNNLLDD